MESLETDKRKFYFVSGLPRSGSTLLCNILAQNPSIHATHTSGCMDVMYNVRNQWPKLIEHRAHPDDVALMRVLRGILHAYYADVEKPIVIDKCRGWLSLLEMAEKVLGHQAKVLVPVRDIRDVLASFEMLWRKNAHRMQAELEAALYFDFQTVEGRCEGWALKGQPVGLAYNRIKDAMSRGFRDRMHFVHFEKLTSDPAATLAGIYGFLNEEPFEHDFDNVEQVTTEDDSVHGFKDLHKIRPKVTPQKSQWPEVLGKAADKYATQSFWANM